MGSVNSCCAPDQEELDRNNYKQIFSEEDDGNI